MSTIRNFDGTEFAYQRTRDDILHGRLQPGQPISQLKLAEQLGLSRGPLREAMRMLQRDGLLVAEFNHRFKVAPLDIADLEQAYAMRIALEPIAVRISIPNLTEQHFSTIAHDAQRAEEPGQTLDDPIIDLHTRFHIQLQAGAPPQLGEQCLHLLDRTERYRRFWSSAAPDRDEIVALSRAEHWQIYEAALARNAELAAELTVRQLARTAKQLISAIDPAYDAKVLRAAVQQSGLVIAD